MAKTLQIHDVPDAVHRQVQARAKLAGLSVSDFVLKELEGTLERPTRQELLAKIAALPELRVEPPPASLIRDERDWQ